MKSFYNHLVLFLLFFFLIILKSNSQNWIWAKSAVGTGQDEGESLCSDIKGNIFITGSFNSPTLHFGSNTLVNASTSANPENIFIAKYDSNGNVIWAKSAEGTGNDVGSCVTADTAGNVFLTGSFGSSTLAFGSTTINNVGGTDLFIAKYDPIGNLTWVKNFGGSGNEGGQSISADVEGNVFLLGSLTSSTLALGTYTITTGSFVSKLDASGNVLWATSIGVAQGLSICTDAFGNMFLTGGFQGPTITFGSVTLTNTGSSDAFLVKYDRNGNVLWAKNAIGSNGDAGSDVCTDIFGNVFVTGLFFSKTISFGSFLLMNTNSAGVNSDVFVAKYDPNGNVLWAKDGGGVGGDQGYSVSADPQGNVYAVGSFSFFGDCIFGSVSLPLIVGYRDPMYIVKYDSTGNLLCASALASGGDETVCVSTDPIGNAYIGGDFWATPFALGSNTLTITSGGPVSENIFVAKYTCNSMLGTSVSHLDVLCNGQCTATAIANPFGGIPPYSYLWNTLPIQTTKSVNGLCVGLFTVTVTDSIGVTAIGTVNITQPSVLNTSTKITVSTCGKNNGNAMVSANGGTSPYTYIWSPVSQTGATISGLSSGDYTATAIDANGCSKLQIVMIASIPLPKANAESNITITQGLIATLSASGGRTYLWSNGATDAIITVNPIISTNYCVAVADTNNCKDSACVMVTIEIRNCEEGIYVPNAFSPNGDNQNDVLYLKAPEKCIQSVTFEIFNRWGNKVFETTDLNSGWDGKHRGKALDSDIFVYTLQAISMDRTILNKKGNISLVK